MDFDAIFQQINIRYQRAQWVSAILTLNRMDVDMISFHSNTALPFPVQNLVQRLRSQTPSTPSEVSAIPCELFGNIPCELFGNTLRALYLKNRDFFCYGETFLPNTRGPLGCLLGFWPSGTKPCGGIKFSNFKFFLRWNNLDSAQPSERLLTGAYMVLRGFVFLNNECTMLLLLLLLLLLLF